MISDEIALEIHIIEQVGYASYRFSSPECDMILLEEKLDVEVEVEFAPLFSLGERSAFQDCESLAAEAQARDEME